MNSYLVLPRNFPSAQFINIEGENIKANQEGPYIGPHIKSVDALLKLNTPLGDIDMFYHKLFSCFSLMSLKVGSTEVVQPSVCPDPACIVRPTRMCTYRPKHSIHRQDKIPLQLGRVFSLHTTLYIQPYIFININELYGPITWHMALHLNYMAHHMAHDPTSELYGPITWHMTLHLNYMAPSHGTWPYI